MAEQPAIYYPDGSSRTRAEVRRKLLAEELTTPSHLTPRPPERDFTEWQPIMARRQKEYKELLAIPESVCIEIATEGPVLLCPIGDVHAEHPETNLERFGKDVDLVKSVNGYFMVFGDLTDTIFWKQNPALASAEEATMYMRSALKYMAEDNRLLCGWLGDHDGWAYDKHGSHTMYADFWDTFNAHLLDGVSYVDINLNDGETEQKYGIVGSHRHPGHSIYNSSHQCLRQWRDEGVGSLISISAHKHTKAHNQQTHKLYGGNEVVFHSVALGTYKESDRHSRKHGWPRKGERSAGAFGIILHPAEEKIHIYWELEDAVDYLSRVSPT